MRHDLETNSITLYRWWCNQKLNTPEALGELSAAMPEFDFAAIMFPEKLMDALDPENPEWSKEKFPEQAAGFIAALKKSAPRAKLIWNNSLPAVVKDKPGQLDEAKNKIVIEHNKTLAMIAEKEGVVVNDLYSLMIKRIDMAQSTSNWKAPFWTYSAYGLMATEANKSILKALGTISPPVEDGDR